MQGIFLSTHEVHQAPPPGFSLRRAEGTRVVWSIFLSYMCKRNGNYQRAMKKDKYIQ
jgi:hypothetical protein